MTRRPTQPLGRTGEDLAARFLAARGFEIVARNVRSRLGEIDLIARDRGTLVFVEVKTRAASAPDPPGAGVDARKQHRMARLALDYLARTWLRDLRCRFDVVGVTLDPGGGAPTITHLPGAFLVDAWPG